MNAFADLAAWLKRTGLGWYLFGAQAAILRGSTRVTADIDVTVVGTLDVVEHLLKTLPKSFETRADRAFTERTFVLPLVHTPSGVPVDVVIGTTQFEAEVHARSELLKVKGKKIPVISGEDLVVLKVLAGRASDLADAEAVAIANPHLDLDAARERVLALGAALDDDGIVARFDRLLRSARPAGRARKPRKKP